MTNSIDLSHLDSSSFEHLVNEIAIYELGPGITTFGDGRDGGRDGHFVGKANYPTSVEQWSGTWYIQSKFHKPHLSTDQQKWLLAQLEEELKLFSEEDTDREWPDNYIFASNIDPSAFPEAGFFDRANELVKKYRPQLRFKIWGGDKLVALLSKHTTLLNRYRHFLTPGHLIAKILDSLSDERASVEDILHSLVVSNFYSQQYLKLDHAGSDSDQRPTISDVFVDLPYENESDFKTFVMDDLVKTISYIHSSKPPSGWEGWAACPSRSPVWFITGGPGQGKSTLTQFMAQLNRAALIYHNPGIFSINEAIEKLVHKFKATCEENDWWINFGRIPIYIELREYAHWRSGRTDDESITIVSYIAYILSKKTSQTVNVGTLKRALSAGRWVAIFDGLDEVPDANKDQISNEVCQFAMQTDNRVKSDMLIVCTSRPQGYSGQFDSLKATKVELSLLNRTEALACADPILKLDVEKYEVSKALLASAIQTEAVAELMTTPLQSHIMAVIVRGGQKPPEKKWSLYRNFYEVIRKREANRNLADKALAKVLLEEENLLKELHNNLGFFLHSRAESGLGAKASISQIEFGKIAKTVVENMKSSDTTRIIEVVTKAACDRLMLINTPVKGDLISFDVRQLQEFFAAEFIYEFVDQEDFLTRLEKIAGDAHWVEVVHFLLSALVSIGRPRDLTLAAEILNRLDEPEAEEYQALYRSLSRGGIIAGNLLRDGVLDSDKRIRSTFTGLIRGLSRTKEIFNLGHLSQIRADSQRWLIDLLCTSIESDRFETSLYSFCYLCRFMETSDASFSRLEGEYEKLSQLQKAKLFDELCFNGRLRASKAFTIRLMYDNFTSQEWLREKKSRTNFRMSLRIYDELILGDLDLDPRIKPISTIKKLFAIDPWQNEVLNEEPISWKIRKLDLDLLIEQSNSILSDLESISICPYGIFLSKAVRFMIASSVENYNAISAAEYERFNRYIPTGIQYFFSDLKFAANETELTKFKDSALKKIHESFQVPEEVQLTAPQFLRLMEVGPDFATGYWLDRLMFSKPEFFNTLNSELTRPKIVEHLCNRPKILTRHFARLPEIFLIFDKPSQEKILQALIQNTSNDTILDQANHNRFEPEPFELSLPSQEGLLKYVFMTAMFHAEFGSFSSEANGSSYAATGKVIYQYIPGISSLEAVVATSGSDVTKFYAYLLGIMHPQGGIDFFHRFLPDFKHRYSNSAKELAVLTHYILDWAIRTKHLHVKEILSLFTDLLINERLASTTHRRTEYLLKKIRESSGLPITSKNHHTTWLGIV